MIKINLGSNNKLAGEGFVNIDVLDLPNVDLFCDLNTVPFELRVRKPDKIREWDFVFENFYDGEKSFNLPNNFVDEIVMDEVLEHLSFRIVPFVLKEIFRIMKVGGVFKLQVPDCGMAMRAYAEGKICSCCPHKGKEEEYIADPNCIKCGGKAIINPVRWLYSFTGAGKHKYDHHLSIFTKEMLEEELRKAGFSNWKFRDSKNKIKLEIIK